MWNFGKERSSDRRESETIDNIRYQFAHIMNGVRIIYTNITNNATHFNNYSFSNPSSFC